ncbi:hypothetical protein AAFF_G00205800 [Aldrovandia affinis]|uniref:Uncharacterized protein n=1 Tax=Aldrovandia affinis TaxID=143900 RepID=A0AAD7W5B9_9TELE|nr:hypothetical protein AAFF_G00205800 [Aldrovandia affinis]
MPVALRLRPHHTPLTPLSQPLSSSRPSEVPGSVRSRLPRDENPEGAAVSPKRNDTQIAPSPYLAPCSGLGAAG